MSSPAAPLSRSTLEAQLLQLQTNHKDLVTSLEQRQHRITELQKQLEVTHSEIDQYRGALSYSKHIQEQVAKLLEQTIAAEEAARLAAESAAKSAEAAR